MIICYRAIIAFNKNNELTWVNSIYENHKWGDHGYICEEFYFRTRIGGTKHK